MSNSGTLRKNKDNQLVLRNDAVGLDEDSVLGKFAKKMKDGYEVTLTPKESKRLICYLNTLKTGFQAAVPILCMGEQCPYAKKCPLGENNNYPMGLDCPIEDTIREVWYNQYATELELSEDSKIDSSLVQDLVFWEMLSKRATEELAIDPKILKRTVAGFQNTKDGLKPVYKDELNMRLTFLERAQKQKMKVLNSLIATREAKSKDTSRMIHDPSQYASKLLEKAKQLTNKAAQHGLVEAESVVVVEGEQQSTDAAKPQEDQDARAGEGQTADRS